MCYGSSTYMTKLPVGFDTHTIRAVCYVILTAFTFNSICSHLERDDRLPSIHCRFNLQWACYGFAPLLPERQGLILTQSMAPAARFERAVCALTERRFRHSPTLECCRLSKMLLAPQQKDYWIVKLSLFLSLSAPRMIWTFDLPAKGALPFAIPWPNFLTSIN